MYCKKCGALLDIKFKQCPKCMEKINLKDRFIEYRELKKYSRKNPKTVISDEEISAIKNAEKNKAYFGRKRRNEFVRTSNTVIIMIVVLILGFLFLVSIYDKRIIKEQVNGGIMATTTEAYDETATIEDSIEGNTENDISIDKEHDLLAAQGIYNLVTDIIEKGKSRYKEGYKRQLLSNKESAVILSDATKRRNDVYGYIWNTLGEDVLTVKNRDNGAMSYSVYIDEEKRVHIYACTVENPLAYELYPDTDEVY